MKYNFDKIIDRRGTNCYKYDEMPNDDTIALWVADMDFETAPCVMDALKKRMEHGCFGYTLVPDSFYQATINWFARRHGWQGIKKEWFIYTSGVVPAISAIIKAMTESGDNVALHNPAYNCFFSSIRNNGCRIECVEWSEDIEEACSKQDVKVFLLCNPHNPTGHVWTEEELEHIAQVCRRHDIFVIADEIHCEFINPSCGKRYIPFATVADKINEGADKKLKYAVCLSPSKAFNIAGLQIANIICPFDSIRRRINRAININEVCDVNPFGVIALQAAYTKDGEEWLTQLNDYIYANYDYTKAFFAEHFPEWKVMPLEGTYLLWVNIGGDADKLCKKILESCNVYINAGSMYGNNNYIRINLATQRAWLEKAYERMRQFIIHNSQFIIIFSIFQ